MSWNPSPTIGSASWSGNPPVATKTQLLSTSAGIIQNIALSTVSTFETITVNQWISTPLLYVSDIKGYSVDISGLSSVTANFALVNTSSLAFTGPSIDAGVKVSVDFSIGDFVWNALVGTGAMVAEVAVGLGVGAGGFFYAIANGAGTLMNAKSPNNPTYINTSNFEVMGSSTQLQVSTLGNAYPVYSSIMRYVSTNVPNQQPGVPEFQSTLFYPGQICIRSISDPYPIVSSWSSIQGSTIQQFGEWVPLLGLEPENIEAYSVSTVNLAAENVVMTNAVTTTLIGSAILAENLLQVGKINDPGTLILPYETVLEQQIGATSYARLLGAVNYWYQQSDQDIVWTKPGAPGVPINMQLSLGSNGNESYLQVSSIFSRGNIQANSAFFSTLTVESLIVVSSFSTIYNVTACNVLSTNLVTASLVSTQILQAQSVYPFQFSSVLGNPTGPFDMTKNDTVVSTTYNQISSLTQNILNYSLNIGVQDQATFNIYNGQSQLALYSVTPANINQWASTLLIFDTYYVPGQIDLGWVGLWGQTPGDLGGAAPGGATFDVQYTYSNQYANSFLITEQSNNNPNTPGISTFFNYPGPAGFTGLSTFRFTLPPVIGGSRSGWWQMTTPAGAPYASSNNNTFQMYQDINDTYIQGTDRLHLVAGDLFLDGTVNSSNMTVNSLYASNATLVNATFNNFKVTSTFVVSTVSTNLMLANNIIVNPVTGGFDSYYLKPSTISFVSGVQSVTPFQSQFYVNSSDYIPQYTLIPPFMGSNQFTSFNYESWNQTIWRNTTPNSLGPPGVYLGDVQTALGPYSAQFWIDNTQTGTPYYSVPIYTITSTGSNLLGYVGGNQYAKIATTNGSSWTLTSNVPTPQGSVGGNFSNITSLTQSIYGTTLLTNQNCFIQSPNQTITTGSLYLYADQIRTNSRRYGSVETAGLASYPIGIENTVYQDNNISWTFVTGTLWQSDATNVPYNVTGDIFYDVNSWIIQVIPSRFRTNNSEIVSWDVQPTVVGVGGGGFCWGFNRYILVNADVGGPGSNANNWNWIIAFPKNYCTY